METKLRLNENKYNELLLQHERYIKNYEVQLFILENLKLLKKKDGTDYQNIKKAFDIESLKPLINKQFNCKIGCGSYLYLAETEFDYEINYSIDYSKGIKGIAYIKKKVYADDLTEEVRKSKAHKIRKDDSWTRAYYNNDTTEEIQEYINKNINLIKECITREKNVIATLPAIKTITEKYIKEFNDKISCKVYCDDIRNLISC